MDLPKKIYFTVVIFSILCYGIFVMLALKEIQDFGNKKFWFKISNWVGIFCVLLVLIGVLAQIWLN